MTDYKQLLEDSVSLTARTKRLGSAHERERIFIILEGMQQRGELDKETYVSIVTTIQEGVE